MHYKKILHEILEDQNYLCLATADKSGNPWSSPVAYVCGEDFSLYFISYTGALHSKNIAENREVAFSIYDSNQTMSKAFGVQASGFAEAVDEWHVPAELKQQLFDKVSLVVLWKEYSFYRITLTDIFLPDAERWKEFHEMRIKIEI